MAGSVNKVILIGNLGKDPEIRRLDNGAVIANFSLATSEVYSDRTTGERKEVTDWHNIVCWRGLAEIAEKYLRKGMKVYVEGKLKTRSWQDKEGQQRYTTEVIVDEMTMLSRNEGGSHESGTPPHYSNQGTPPSPSKIDSIINKDDDETLPF